VVARNPERFEVFALSAHRQVDKLAELCRRFRPKHAVVAGPQEADALRTLLIDIPELTIGHGAQALVDIASAAEVTTVMAAIVGAAGLASTLAAARSGKRILLANKEALVMAGDVFMSAVRASGAVLLPVDSEHNAVFQSLPAGFDYGLKRCGVRKIILTASGGPFRRTPLSHFPAVTPREACAHPNWSMGRKISVDSATMMNKGLEVIEASWIFGVPADRIDVLIHPESTIHSMVQYEDGSVLAELGNPDMRTPIAHAMGFPDRLPSGVADLDLASIGKLSFEPADFERFPCLALAYEALRSGGSAPAIMNAANEEAVAAFLGEQLRFDQIPLLVQEVMERCEHRPVNELGCVMEADAQARALSRTLLNEWAGAVS
jgi:1-deoxy-D-xylulose-5-phosphate reductoisomerase